MSKKAEKELAALMASFEHDPLGFVLFSFPWGKGRLLGKDGPDAWQTDILQTVGREGMSARVAVQIAVASGHGIGKTALVAWLILWFMSTRVNANIVVTANTKVQLTSKTWRELALWWKISINRHWFKITATRFFALDSPETWKAEAIPWSENNSEAFAGTHADHVMILFDEASGVHDIIWEVSSGGLTTNDCYWLVFGNPTKNTGRFRECFGRYKHRWITRNIDSRNAKMANKELIQQWIDDYGEDSDYCRRRVTGRFPRAGNNQLIPSDIVDDAVGRSLNIEQYNFAPVVLGVDVAWEGGDSHAIVMRQGLMAKVLGVWRDLPNQTMSLADLVIKFEDKYKADAVFVDSVGVGVGVIDRLRQLGREPIAVNSSTKASHEQYMNKRIEMWDSILKWLESGGSIPDNQELIEDLISPESGIHSRSGKKYLESKPDMESSPDVGDALALTFFMPVRRKDDIRDRLKRHANTRKSFSVFDRFRRNVVA